MKITINHWLLAAFALSLCALIASDFGVLFGNINNFIQSLTNIVLAAVAIYGVNTWQRQERSKLIDEYRILFYEAKRAFKHITYSFSLHLENEHSTPWIGYRRRAELHKDTFIKIESHATEFGVRLGENAESVAREIVKLYIMYESDLNIYAEHSRRLQKLKYRIDNLRGTTINGRTMEEAHGDEVQSLENDIAQLESNFSGDRSKYNQFFEREDILKVVNNL